MIFLAAIIDIATTTSAETIWYLIFFFLIFDVALMAFVFGPVLGLFTGGLISLLFSAAFARLGFFILPYTFFQLSLLGLFCGLGQVAAKPPKLLFQVLGALVGGFAFTYLHSFRMGYWITAGELGFGMLVIELPIVFAAAGSSLVGYIRESLRQKDLQRYAEGIKYQ
jgi:hypothetical protein